MYQEFITSVLAEASKIALANFGKVKGSTKPEDNNQVLTKADLDIGNLLIRKIQQKFPDHNVIDEEAGVIDKKSDYTWVLDPIDGTSNFASSVPTYGSTIGLLHKDQPLAGGVVLPAFQEAYYAEKSKGTLCNGRPVHVTSETKLSSALVAYGIDGHTEDPERTRGEAKIICEIALGARNLRSNNCVFDIAMLASGKYGASLNQSSKIWDNVAQQIIVEEAGGVYTDFFGKLIDYSDPISKATTNFTWCAAPPALHGQLQNIINE